MNLLCSSCKEEKPTSEFSRANSKRGFAYKCKVCHNTYVREVWYAKNADKQKAAVRAWESRNKAKVLAYTYGTSPEIIQPLLDRNLCDICGETENLHIDHCHESGEIRGILCRGCNHGLGNFTDDVDKLRKAIVYLKNKPVAGR
jgi:hypothetical protein